MKVLEGDKIEWMKQTLVRVSPNEAQTSPWDLPASSDNPRSPYPSPTQTEEKMPASVSVNWDQEQKKTGKTYKLQASKKVEDYEEVDSCNYTSHHIC